MTTEYEPPIFRSVHAALAFAFNLTHGTLKKNALARLQGGGGEGRGLAGLDGAAQAGLIKQAVKEQSEVHRYILVTKFAPKSLPCPCERPCCRGWKDNPEWDEAVGWLTEHLLTMGLTGTISHYRFRRSLVLRYFGARLSFVDIAKECGINRDTASDHHAKVLNYLKGKPPEYKGAEWRALAAIEAHLKGGGLIE